MWVWFGIGSSSHWGVHRQASVYAGTEGRDGLRFRVGRNLGLGPEGLVLKRILYLSDQGVEAGGHVFVKTRLGPLCAVEHPTNGDGLGGTYGFGYKRVQWKQRYVRLATMRRMSKASC